MTASTEPPAARPLLSIVTPVFNGLPHLQACIDSVLPAVGTHQDRSVEHLIIDGASSDGTAELLSVQARRYPHLRVRSEPDSGQPEAINKGVRLSRGHFVCLLNADDVFDPSGVQDALAALASLRDNSDRIVIGNLRIRNAAGELIHTTRHQPFSFYRLLLGEMPINPLSYFYPRSLHERIGWYDEQDHYSHDIDFLIRASRHLRPVHIEAVIGEFRMVAGSKTLATIEDGTLQQRKLAVIQRHRRQLSAHERLLLNAWRLRNKVMGLVPDRR